MDFIKPTRNVNKVFIHCSASDAEHHDDIEVIRQWHTNPPPYGRGWSDIGYHFFITRNGEIQTGRDLEKIPAAQAGHNTGSIAICVHGLTHFADTQFESLIKLCKTINNAYDDEITFHGHCEVNPHKTCPVFDYKNVLELDDNGYLGELD